MNYFLRLGAYIWHPLLMPLLGAVIYFLITPRYLDPNVLKAKVFAIAIVTLLIPIVVYFILKNLGMVNSISLAQVWERKVPLMIQSMLLLLLIKYLLDPYIIPELYFFFVGILFTSLAALLLVFFRVKASLHQMGIAGLTFFVIALSVHFHINMLFWIAFFIIANGWVASSRLHTNSHTITELVLGFFLGIVPQIIMLNFWL